MPRHRIATAALTLALLGGAAAGARGDEPGAIAVLPLSSPDKRLEMYGVAISRAIAGELRGRTSAPIHPVSGSSELPPRIAWVIDGRIVSRSRGLIVLEARVRDPSRGRASGQVASRPGKLTEIDRLAKDLASQLAPLIARAEVERASLAARPAPPTATPAATGAAARASPPPPARPPLLISRDREPIVTDALAALAVRLGYTPLVAPFTGIAPQRDVLAQLRRTGARRALLARVDGVDYRWRGVLTARGRMRLVLFADDGRTLYDGYLRTDTLIGSRADRHAALLGFVARQVMDIAWPRLRKALAR